MADGTRGLSRGAAAGGCRSAGTLPAPGPPAWRRVAVLAALMVGAFALNTAENLPVGLLRPIAEDLRVPVPAVGLLVTGYGLTVAGASLPLTHLTRAVPRRYVLTGLLGALVVSSLVAALAASYGTLLAARLLTALAQALFWAVMGPVAVGLFPPAVRGRVVGALSVAGSLALVLGVPAGTWLGRHSGWQTPVGLLAVLGAVPLVTIAALLPTSRPDEEPAAYGTRPDRRRFWTVLAAGALSATGMFAGYTYVTAFLGDVAGFPPDAVNALLVAFGVACLAGVTVTGALLDRFPRAALTGAVGTGAVSLLGLYAAGTVGAGTVPGVSAGVLPAEAEVPAGTVRAVVVVCLLLLGGALASVFMATQHEMLRCAPARTDLALAANSGAYNAGIAAGAALGALALRPGDVRDAFLAGGLVAAGACAVLLGGRMRERAR